jgi:hypothetical protein
MCQNCSKRTDDCLKIMKSKKISTVSERLLCTNPLDVGNWQHGKHFPLEKNPLLKARKQIAEKIWDCLGHLTAESGPKAGKIACKINSPHNRRRTECLTSRHQQKMPAPKQNMALHNVLVHTQCANYCKRCRKNNTVFIWSLSVQKLRANFKCNVHNSSFRVPVKNFLMISEMSVLTKINRI